MDPICGDESFIQFLFVLFSLYLGEISNLTSIFQMGWFNHQLAQFVAFVYVQCITLSNVWFATFVNKELPTRFDFFEESLFAGIHDLTHSESQFCAG